MSLGFSGAGFFDGMDKAQVVAKSTGREIENAFGGIGSAITGALAPLGEFGGMLGAAFDSVGSSINSALQGVTNLAGGGGFGLLAGAAAGVGAAVLAADAAFIGIAIHATKGADEIYEMSQKTGIAVSTLSKFTEVGKLVGIETETMTKSIEKMNKSAYAASTAPAEASNAYTKLGVAVRDASGELKTPDALLLELADKFSKMHNGVAKTALAMQIFGRGGAELIPFLNKGRDGVAELSAKVEALGAVLTEQTAAAAHQFQEDLREVGVASDGVQNKLMTALVPTLTVVADALVSALEDSGSGLNKFIDGVGYVTKGFLILGETAWAVLQSIGLGLAEIINIDMLVGESLVKIKQKLEHFDFSGAKDDAAKGMAAIEGEIKTGAQAASDIWTNYTSTVGKLVTPPPPKTEKKGTGDGPGAAESVKDEAAAAKQILDISDARYKEQAAQAGAYYSKGEIDAKQLLDAQIFATNAEYQAHETYFSKLKVLYADDPQKLAAVNAEKTKFELGALTTALEGVAKANERYDETVRKVMEDSAKENLKEQAHSMDAMGAATLAYVKSIQAQVAAQAELKAATGKGDYQAQVDAIKEEMAEGLKAKTKGWAEIESLDKQQLAEQLKDLKENATLLAAQEKQAEAGLLAAQKTGDQAQLLEAKSFYNQTLAAITKNKADQLTAATVGNKQMEDAEIKSMADITAAREKMADAFAATAAKSVMSTKDMAKNFEALGKQMVEQMIANTIKIILEDDKVKASAAGTAAAKAYQAVYMAVPYPLDMVLAPITAAIAYAGVMSFDQGGISEQGGLSMLHPREMVLPAEISDGLQSMIKSANVPGREFMAGPNISNTYQNMVAPGTSATTGNTKSSGRSTHVTMNIATPDANSFGASQGQIHTKLHHSLETARKRNK